MGKLREIKYTKQDDPDLIKKWYTDDSFWDLYVWYNNNNQIVGVQLCYNKEYGEYALTWFENKEFSHKAVSSRRDSKGYRGSYDGSPILVYDGIFNKAAVLERFIKDSTALDQKIINIVKEKIIKFKNA